MQVDSTESKVAASDLLQRFPANTYEAQQESQPASDGADPVKVTPSDQKRAKLDAGNVTALQQRIVHGLDDDERERNHAAEEDGSN